MDPEKVAKLFFWLVIFLVVTLQFIFTVNSTLQIRYEELAESVRNVYWLQNRTIYDGVSSNIGWYGTLMIVYNLFGFSLSTAQMFRFFLQIISLFCLAFILKKYLKENAWLPLLTTGLSPTLIYFNSLVAQIGIDLQYFPICLFLIVYKTRNKFFNCLKTILLWAVAMIAWMTYPTFAFYLPSLWGIYLWNLFKDNNNQIRIIIQKLMISLFPFIVPLIIGFLYIKDPTLLVYDSHEKSGLFRGAGSLRLDLNIFWQNITRLSFDLFQKGASYYFELPQPDFSNYYPVISVVFVIISSVIIFIKKRQYRLILLAALSIFILNLFFANFNIDPSRYPGLRRNTGLLASFYFLFVITWHYFSNVNLKSSLVKNLIFVVFLLLPLHHLLAYPVNFDSLKYPSSFRELWFGQTPYPNKYLETAIQALQNQNLPLSCKDKEGKITFCRYAEIYGALAGACYWNKVNCKQILGYDPKTKKFVPLSVDLWRNYYWPH